RQPGLAFRALRRTLVGRRHDLNVGPTEPAWHVPVQGDIAQPEDGAAAHATATPACTPRAMATRGKRRAKRRTSPLVELVRADNRPHPFPEHAHPLAPPLSPHHHPPI